MEFRTVRGCETKVVLKDGEFSIDRVNGSIRAAVFQDDMRRQIETSTLYSKLAEFEKMLVESDYDQYLAAKLPPNQLQYYDLLGVSECGGRYRFERKRNAITAKENSCGRFAILTTSDRDWKELLIQYRQRNDVEYDFSRLQSDLFVEIKGRSTQMSAEGGLLINFLSLRLRLTLLKNMKQSKVTDVMWIPKVLKLMRKLRISLSKMNGD